jgi:hypothetical protein
MTEQNYWRLCSACKKEIPLGGVYQVCSVSTCRQKRTNYVFCSVECWDKHVPVERHRGDDVGAIEKRAPRTPEAEPQRKKVVTSAPNTTQSSPAGHGKTSVDGQVLVVASKIKKYISEKSGMNTSASTMDALTERIRRICDQSINNARASGRKTVMDKDVP